MQLNHLDLPSSDPAGTMAFFVEQLGVRVFFTRADGLVVGEDPSGFVLTVSPLPAGAEARYPSGFHVGAVLFDEAEVWAAWARLETSGVPVLMAPRLLAGALTFQVEAPGAVCVEFTVRRGSWRVMAWRSWALRCRQGSRCGACWGGIPL